MAGSEATLRKTLGHGDWQTPGHSVIQQMYNLYCYSINHVSMTSSATAFITSLWSLYSSTYHVTLISRYSIYYVTKTSIVTASSPSLWSPLLQHLPRHYDPYNYNTYYVAMTSIATASTMALWSLFVTAYTTPLWSLLLQHLLRQFDLSLQHL